MEIDIFLKSKNQYNMIKELGEYGLYMNWRSCHEKNQYIILKKLTSYMPTIKGKGNINCINTLVKMAECVKYFIDNGKVCSNLDLPVYDSELYENYCIHLADRELENTDENKLIALKLYLWLLIGIINEAEIVIF